MKKRVWIPLGCAVCAACFIAGVSAAGLIEQVTSEIRRDFTIVIDGKEQTFRNAQGEQVYPLLYDGTTYLPVRAIGNLMGKTVYWYEDEKRIELKDGGSTVTDADVIVGSGNNGSSSVDYGSNITVDQAKEIALKKAGVSADEATFTKAHSDYDDGAAQYELEFWVGKTEYSADVRKSDGQITSWDVDYNKTMSDAVQTDPGDITLERAKAIAVGKAGLSESEVIFTETTYDYDDGVRVFEIEFRKGSTEYSAEIRASNGDILSWDIDNH